MRSGLAATILSVVVVLIAGCGGGSKTGVERDILEDGAETVVGDASLEIDAAVDDGGSETVSCKTHEDCKGLAEHLGPCYLAMCDQAEGVCVSGPAKPGTPCDDGNPCTEETYCIDLACTGGRETVCEDGLPCTLDSCDQVKGCVFEPTDAAACDDGNPCTTSDECDGAQCVGEATDCGCQNDEDCVQYDDKDLCNGYLVCKSGTCVPADGSAVVCPPPPSPCAAFACKPETGSCGLVPAMNGLPCEDADYCTGGDKCASGECVPGDKLLCAECEADGECEYLDSTDACAGKHVCNDGHCVLDLESIVSCSQIPCYVPSCDSATGNCSQTQSPDGTWCDDKDACTGPDKCGKGTCKGLPLSCDDGNVCTTDSCDPGEGCSYKALSDIPCDDSSLCTEESWCKEGQCKAEEEVSCDDSNPCTQDTCTPEEGCMHQELHDTPCDDLDACTIGDWCVEGECAPGENVCQCKTDADCEQFEDLNLCNGTLLCQDNLCVVDLETVITCDVSQDTDCRFTKCNPIIGQCEEANAAYGSQCDDGNLCTFGSVCFYGSCFGGVPQPCDDSNPCTEDSCAPDSGCVFEAVDGPSCSDDDPCTSGDECVAGECHAGNNICQCQSTADCAQFEDGDLCNGTLACQDQVCKVVPDSVKTCPLSPNPCQVIKCLPTTGECKTSDVPNSTPCNDGDSCTTQDACYNGVCTAKLLDCFDSNPCTKDSCDPKTGCVFELLKGTECEDGNPCTQGDKCADGACVSGNNVCDCETEADCADQDDGDPCTGEVICVEGKCTLDETTIVVCSSANDTPCVKNKCNPKTGMCEYTPLPDGSECADGLVCTTQDTCQEGNCKGDMVSCNDSNPCTNDGCLEQDGGCVFVPNTSSCDDSNPCTKNDSCSKGTCKGEAVVCSDDNGCTQDKCDPAVGCVYTPTSAPCDDGNECTADDFCQAGACLGKQIQCDDSNVCTQDDCDPDLGCVHYDTNNPCDDGNLCTDKDVCSGGKCVPGPALNCDDAKQCTADTCEPTKGCVHTNQTGSDCDDGNKCTTNDKCQAGACIGGTALSCDDLNPCSGDSCIPETGCAHAPLSSGKCDDSNACTNDDSCSNGNCIGKIPVDCNDKVPCTSDSCDPTSGCVHLPVPNDPPVACDDGNACTTSDLCLSGSCSGTKLVTCNDSKPCTDDSCDPAIGCKYTPDNTNSCVDSDVCNGVEKCSNGNCIGGLPPSCDDLDFCTTDWCDPATGCSHKPSGLCSCNIDSDCDDGNKCNGLETCVSEGGKKVCKPGTPKVCDPSSDTECKKNRCVPESGACVMTPVIAGIKCEDTAGVCTIDDKCDGLGSCKGTQIDCNDSNPCTDDPCSPSQGCYYKNNTGPCSDGNPCTTGDVCSSGSCHGAPFNCNDSNPCTDDSCVPDNNGQPKCSHVNNMAPCNDSNECTSGDHCSSGACVGALVVCQGDGNPCTNDFCDPIQGCISQKLPDGTVCDDTNLCTTGDACLAGACKGSWTFLCCNSSADCKTQGPCSSMSCNSGKCSYLPKNCGDANSCTADVCTAGACTNEALRTDIVLFRDAFEDGDANDWLLGTEPGATEKVFWSVSSYKPASGKFSLYAGDPATHSYNFQAVADASAWAPPIRLPEEAVSSLSFKIWAGFDPNDQLCTFDYLRVDLYDIGAGSTSSLTPWVCKNTAGHETRTYDLSAWKGKSVRFKLAFRTVDANHNNGEGVYVDDFTVTALKKTGCCLHDGDCDDSEGCTDDDCQTFACSYPKVPGTFFAEDFDTGSIPIGKIEDPDVWTVSTNNVNVKWQVDNWASSDTPFALYAGNVKTHSYDFGASSATIRTPMISLPAGSFPVLKIMINSQLAEGGCADKVTIGVATGPYALPTVKQTWCTITKAFIALDTDLSEYAGKDIYVHFGFEANATNNAAQGAFIDDVRVVNSDAALCCDSDPDCDDNDYCTVDMCLGTPGSGACIRKKVINHLMGFDGKEGAVGWIFSSQVEKVQWQVVKYTNHYVSPWQSLYCGNFASHTYQGYGGGSTSATTPFFFIDNVEKLSPVLGFNGWLDIDGFLTANDCLTVEVQPQGGFMWNQLGKICADDPWVKMAAWQPYSYPLDKYRGLSVQFRFTLSYSNSLTGSHEGVYLDDFKVSFTQCP